MNKTARAALPWALKHDEFRNEDRIVDANGLTVAIPLQDQEKIDLIVRAVNNLDTLRLAVINVMAIIGNHHDPKHERAYAILKDAFDKSKSNEELL